MKQQDKAPIAIDFDLKPRLKSNLIKNLFLLFTRSDFFREKEATAGRKDEKRSDRTTLQVDYDDKTTTGRTRPVALDSSLDPNLQRINVFFQNLCQQETTLLELKTVSRQEQFGVLKKLDRNLQSGRVPILDRFVPVLELISKDRAAAKNARSEARRIAQGIRSLMAALGESRTAGSNGARPSQHPVNGSSRQPVAAASEEGTLRVFVELVELDVIVTDRKGRHITDLRKEDFRVLQDGKLHKIQAISYVGMQPDKLDQGQRNGKAVKSTEGSMETGPASNHGLKRRAIAVVVDELGLTMASINRSKKALRRFINQQIRPNDLVALVRTGVETAEISFTSNKSQLLKALDEVRFNPMSRPGLDTPPGVSRQLQRSKQARAKLLTLDTLGTLWRTVSLMKQLPFRRSLVLVSDGLRLDYSDKVDDVDIVSQIKNATRLVTDECHRASLVVYSIDARGLDSLSFRAERVFARQMGRRSFHQHQQRSGLHLLAADTGGMFFKDSNDLNHATQRILRDQQGYYLIAYTPDQSGPEADEGRFDKIKVKVNRRGLRVRSRSAAFGK
jgi:VWFA-related protein